MSKNGNYVGIDGERKIDKPLLTVKEVSSLLGESVHIIRNWLKDLKDFIPIDKSDAGYNLFGEEAMDKLRTIQRLHRDNGYSMKQIEYYFATGGKDFIPVPSAPGAEELLAKELQFMRDELKSMREQMKQQEDFNRELTKQLDSLVKERDELLLQSMNEIKEHTTNLLISSKLEEQVKSHDPAAERQARVTEMITLERVKGELRKEALHLWLTKPESERMKRKGLFGLKQEEDHAARDLFVRAYIDERLGERLAQEYGIDKV